MKKYKKERCRVRLDDITRHPFAASIYELNDIDKLAENIDRNGIIQAVPIIDNNNQTLSGNRVVEACRQLG